MTLTDAGPLVALLDQKDSEHRSCVEVLKQMRAGQLATTWPCFTEAMYILGTVGGYRYQERLWTMRRNGTLIILDITAAEADRMDGLTKLYQNVPMDLADASLVAIAEKRGFRRLFTIDSDFFIYRLPDGSAMDVIR